jgi:peptidoglycan/LPS O-acetylase OafA/YrhL
MIEIHFYLLLPLAYLLLRRWSSHADWWTFLLFLLVPSAVRLATYAPGPVDLPFFSWHANLLPRALDYFAPGILFAIVWRRYRRSEPAARAARLLAPAGAVLLVLYFVLHAYLRRDLLAPGGRDLAPPIWIFELFRALPALAAFLLLFVLYLPAQHWLPRALSFRPLTFIGLVSYEWFLFHQPPVKFLTEKLGNAQGSLWIYLGRTVLPMAATLALAAAIYFWFSAPILAWTKRRLAARP